MKKRWIATLMTAAVLLGLTACGGQETAEEDPIPAGTAVEIQIVERGDIATESTVTGMVSADRNVPVMPPVSCKVKEVKVKAGDTVQAGDALFVMDTADLRDLYGTVLNTYSSTKALLDEQVRQTKETLENLKVLYEMGAVSKSTVDQTELGLMQAESTRESTLAQLGLKDVLDTLSDPVVTAPISGTITNVGITAGVITSNTSPAVVISEISRPQVVVNVSETLQPYLHTGDQVEVVIPSLSEEPVTGTISSVASAISQTSALYEVHIALPESVDLSIGMFARAYFRTDARTDAVLVPTEAILTSEEEQYVYIVADGAAYRVTVTTGLVGEKETEIVTGLTGGEQLVTRGQSYLSDGAPVRITEGSAA